MAARIFNNRYEAISKLGEGGMGEVYLVRDLVEERQLALKLLKGSQEHLVHFKHEFSLLSRLDHPGLLHVYDFGFADRGRSFFYTCELVEGADLFSATSKLDFEQLYGIVRQILFALSYVHARGLIHHDIKPQNIIVAAPSEEDPGPHEPVVRLMDFGLSSEERDVGGPIKGTIHYLAPEVVREQACDRRVDLYALGVTLYYVVTRQLPFEGASAVEVVKKHLAELPEPPATLNPSVPEGWSRFILRLLEKNPADRYADAEEACADLAQRLDRKDSLALEGATMGSLLAGRFVGREELMHQLVATLPGEDSGPRLVTLAGPPGVGKTRLLRELKVHAQFHDIPFLAGSCQREGESSPAGLDQVLRATIAATQGQPEAGAIIAAAEPSLRALFPKVLDESRAARPRSSARLRPSAATPARRLRHFDELARMLLALAARVPLVIALEDIHWADDTTRALLAAISRNMAFAESLPVPRLTVLLTRRREREEELAALLNIWEELPLHQELDVGLLDAAQVSELVRSMLAMAGDARSIGEPIHRATGGNPFFVEELVKAFLEEGVVCLRQGLVEGVDPERLESTATVAEVLGERLARLPEMARAVIEALAIHGVPVDLRVLVNTTCKPAGEVLRGVHHLQQREMLWEHSEGDRRLFALRHRQIGDSVLRSLNPRALKALHGMAAMAVEECVLDPSLLEEHYPALAYHFDRAELGKKSFFYVRKAAARAMRLERNEEAIGHLRRALELLRAGAGALHDERSGEAALLAPLGNLLSSTGRSREAAEVFSNLVSLGQEAAGQDAHTRGLRQLGAALVDCGDYEAAGEILRSALALGDRQEPSERARTLGSMSRIALRRGDYLSACRLAQEAGDALPEGLHFPDARRRCFNSLVAAESVRGHYGRVASAMRGSLGTLLEERSEERPDREIVERLGIDISRLIEELSSSNQLCRPYGDGYGLSMLTTEVGAYLDMRGRAAEALAYATESCRTYERLGYRHLLAMTLNNVGVATKLRGEFARALEAFERALAIVEGQRDRYSGAMILLNLSLLALSLGDIENAERRARRVLSQARQVGVTWLVGHAYRTLARILFVRGDAISAARVLQRANGVFQMLRSPRNLAAVMIDQAEAALARGDLPEARRVVAAARDTGDRKAPEFLARRDAVLGRAALLDGDTHGALALLEDALDQARRSGINELERDLGYAVGSVHRRLGARWLASQHMREAEALDKRAGQELPPELAAAYRGHIMLSPFRREAAELARLVEED